jgi:outer membrane protein assembly complex protein YaeT
LNFLRQTYSAVLIIATFLVIHPSQLVAQNGSEGTQRIWDVEIEGNTAYEDIVIEQYIANQRPGFWKRLVNRRKAGVEVNYLELRKDVIRIQRFYQRRGYLDAKVSYRLVNEYSAERLTLIFTVQENRPVRIRDVQVSLEAETADSQFIENSEVYQRALQRIQFRSGRRYQQIEEPEVVGRLTRLLKNLGYVYATSTVTVNLDSLSNEASIQIKNVAGPRARITNINVVGNSTLDERFILRETGIDYGDYYSEGIIRNAQQEVFKHHLFRLALISIPEQPRDTTLELLLRVKELPLRSIRLRAGVGDFDRLDGPIYYDNFYKIFRTQATWVYRNVRGRGEQFSTNVKLSYYDKYLGLEYLFPYVFNTKSSFSVNPFIQNRIEKTYSITRGGLVNSFGYEYNRNLTGTFSYEFALNNEYDIANERNQDVVEILPDSILAYNISSFQFNAYYARGLERGRRGLIIQPYLEFSGLFGESTFSFQKAALDVRKYFEVTQGLVLASRVRLGAIYYAKQDSLPADIEYYSGGTSSVRGWGRDDLGPKRASITYDTTSSGIEQKVRYVPTGGRAFLNFNVEARKSLNGFIKGLGMAVFLDGGQVWGSIRRLEERPIQFGTGGGLRYNSPIGPIRIDLAYKINPTDQDLGIYRGVDYGGRFSRWHLHFSIGQAF